MRYILSSLSIASSLVASSLAIEMPNRLYIDRNWTLLGASVDLDSKTLDKECIEKIYSYDSNWSSYPNQSQPLFIEKNRGFWIKGSKSCTLNIDGVDSYSEFDRVVTLDSEDRGFIINLTSTPSTGYSWSISNLDETLFKEPIESFYSDSSLLGSSGVERIYFPLKSDKLEQNSTINLQYRRSFENELVKDINFTITTEELSALKRSFNLSTDKSWSHLFADYSDEVCESDGCKMEAGYSYLPLGYGESVEGYMIASENHSDDMLMGIYRKVENLESNQTYEVRVDVKLLTNYCGEDLIGIGGSPTTSNYIKAGAIAFEPKVTKNESGYYSLNFDKGNQAGGSESIAVIGDLAVDCSVEVPVPNDNSFREHSVTTEDKFLYIEATSNESGELWLFIGNDSGFEGYTKLYFLNVELSLLKR